MSITVRDIMELNLLRDSEIISGKNGLDREVTRVNFTDCPIQFNDLEYTLALKGDLYIRSLYWVKDDEKELYDTFYFYVTSGSSCCLVTNEYLPELPKHILELTDKHNYPVIKIDSNVPYGDLIRDISELLMTEQSELFFENKLNRLLYETLSTSEILEIGKYINPLFKKEYITICLNLPGLDNRQFYSLQSDLKVQYQLRLRRYQNGGFIIFNYQERAEFDAALPGLRKLFHYYCNTYSSGISGAFENAADFQQSIRQACSSLRIGIMLKQQWTYPDDLHIYNLLMAVHDNAALKNFYTMTLAPLIQYEKRYSVDLIKTIETYLTCDGDYKKTAILLKRHENTIRFRINKAKSLLGMENSHYKFIEQVSLALKARSVEKFSVNRPPNGL